MIETVSLYFSGQLSNIIPSLSLGFGFTFGSMKMYNQIIVLFAGGNYILTLFLTVLTGRSVSTFSSS